MKFSILVNSAPFSHQSAHTAYQFCKAALENNHQILRVFFYQDGVYNANKFSASLTSEAHLVDAWQTLATQYQIELVLCVTSATQRGIIETNLADTFKISGLGQLLDAVINADRFLSFG
jgi:tRNA 2-thiouridine synthesizing protein D